MKTQTLFPWKTRKIIDFFYLDVNLNIFILQIIRKVLVVNMEFRRIMLTSQQLDGTIRKKLRSMNHRKVHRYCYIYYLTHCVRNRLSHTIYWKSPISILGTPGFEIYIFLEKNG